MSVRRILRVVAVLAWAFAVWRWTADAGDAGPVVQAMVAGGWGLSLLPVHVAARRPRRTTRTMTRRYSPDRRKFADQAREPFASGWQRGHQ